MHQTPWTELNFMESALIDISMADHNDLEKYKFIIHEYKKAHHQWIKKSDELTREFAGVFHSAFLRWAVTVNGLNVAAEKYSSMDWKNANKGLTVSGIRHNESNSQYEAIILKTWDGNMAAQVSKSSIPMLAGWAFCNMYACIEEFILKLCRIYLEEHPDYLIQGQEFRELRKLYSAQKLDPTLRSKWFEKLNVRLDDWHKKIVFKGMEKIFNKYITFSKIEMPNKYKGLATYSDIGKTLGGISLIRNCFIHGVTTVPKELEEFCHDFTGLAFHFVAGSKFRIGLTDLALFECFASKLTATLNLSYCQLAYPEIYTK